MKRKWLPLLAAALIGWACAAFAAERPDVVCFSPGIRCFDEHLAAGESVETTASLAMDKAFFARDLSVLSEMLSGAVFTYFGDGDGTEGTDALSIQKEGVDIFSAELSRSPEGEFLRLNGERCALPAMPEWAGLAELGGMNPLESIPLPALEARLAALCVGDALPFGWTVAEAFNVTSALSDDGEKMTRLEFQGAIATAGGEAYAMAGKIFQPRGKAPKETWEITLTRDEKNIFTITLSSTRKSESAKKGKTGKAQVDTTIRSEGKLNGYRVSTRLIVKQRNQWTASEDELSERITVSASLTHQDKRPGMQMLRLNSVEGEMHDEITVVTREGQSEAPERCDAFTLSLKMDSYPFLSVGADARTRLGVGRPERGEAPDAQIAEMEEFDAAWEKAIRRAAAALYAQLGDKQKAKIAE